MKYSRQTQTKYTIKKGDLFYNGCHRYGRDKDGIYRISKTKWSNELTIPALQMSQQEARDVLKGILRYDSDKNGVYDIILIKKTVEIEIQKVRIR